MATRRYSINPGDNDTQVTEAAGAAVATKNIELTVNLANVLDGATKAISRDQVLVALEQLKQYIMRGNWPPA
jgi:hypothetical protein